MEVKKWTEADVLNLIRATHPPDEWYFLAHVRSDAGFGTGLGSVRTADAIAFNLWPSRGLEVRGFEVKTSRADWVRELGEPTKAEAVFGYCDRWYLAVPDVSIVREDELPPTWGLMAPSKRAVKMQVVTSAPKLEPPALDRGFVAAMFRRALRSKADDRELEAAFKRGQEAARRERKGLVGSDIELELDRLRHLEDRVLAFEKASGLSIAKSWRRGQQVGEAVARVLKDEDVEKAALNRLRELGRDARALVAMVEKQIEGKL